MDKPHVLILGAGPAGVGAAYRLRRLDRARVTVVERRAVAGGNAGSFEIDGQRVDYGSHRLHPACDTAILEDLRALLGDDLITRARHGRILLNGKWIHFPLRPVDLLLHADRRLVLGSLRDAVSRLIRRSEDEKATFSAHLLERLGPTVCDSFYFPYARKIWGRTPEELSAYQAHRRVSAQSFPKLLRKVFGMIPGRKRAETGRFYYPRHGYGQISEAFSEAAAMDGATHLMGCKVTRLMRPHGAEDLWTVEVDQGGDRRTLEADYVWSTIPINMLAKMMHPPAPSEVIEAANSLEYRAILLIYLQLPVDRFTEYDAHYFPEAAISITRMSEPKNYVGAAHPHGRTTLCAELPCSPDEAHWTKTEAELGALVADDLDRAGIPLPCKPDGVFVMRLRQAYPIYSLGYERHFSVLDDWADQLPRLLSYGRQGLFVHDNTHHALAMAYAAADCMADGVFDSVRWHAYRSAFETHVVED